MPDGHSADLTGERKKEISRNNKDLLLEKWERYLRDPRLPGRRVREAILPVFHSWIDKETGQLDHYLTQMITDHGSFRRYLYKMNKVDSGLCLHCRRSPDTAEHTMAVCSSWHQERQDLMREVGDDLSLGAVIPKMLASTAAWEAFGSFCKKVLTKKEEVRRLISAGEIER